MRSRRRVLGKSLDLFAKWLLKFRLISIPARKIADSSFAWSVISRSDRVRANRLKDRIVLSELPKHVSIIMDGNRRFAWSKSSPVGLGHSEGKEKLKEVMDWVLDLGIPYFTVYALSTENILRGKMKSWMFSMICMYRGYMKFLKIREFMIEE